MKKLFIFLYVGALLSGCGGSNVPKASKVENDKGKDAEEKGLCAETGKVLVEIDPRFFRPTEVDLLLGDPTKAYQKLGWKHSTPFKDLVKDMVEADMKAVEIEKTYRRHGFE